MKLPKAQRYGEYILEGAEREFVAKFVMACYVAKRERTESNAFHIIRRVHENVETHLDYCLDCIMDRQL
jgi:hypothetical protein